MAKEIAWELCRSFLAVLQEGSLSGAARALNLAQPTVGRHIGALEKALGAGLFTRSHSGLLPTEAALGLRPFAEGMSNNAAALARAAESQGKGIGGTVRVTASEVVGAEVLPPVVAQLRADYPELKLELVLTNRVQDLLRHEADIAVRMAPPRQQSLIARRVGQVELGLHAHQRYLERNGTPRTPADLPRHALIGFDVETPFLRAASKALPVWQRAVFALRTDSDLAQLALIRSGAGIGVCHVALARRDSALVRVLPRHFRLSLDTWLTMHEDLRAAPRCQVTFGALLKGLERYINVVSA